MPNTTTGEEKSNERERGNAEKASPAAVERYIKGTNFPANKKQLMEKAKSNSAPQDIINVLNKFEDKQYNSPIDIAKEMGRMGQSQTSE